MLAGFKERNAAIKGRRTLTGCPARAMGSEGFPNVTESLWACMSTSSCKSWGLKWAIERTKTEKKKWAKDVWHPLAHLKRLGLAGPSAERHFSLNSVACSVGTNSFLLPQSRYAYMRSNSTEYFLLVWSLSSRKPIFAPPHFFTVLLFWPLQLLSR